MGLYVNPDNADFAEIRWKEPFVDKSNLLHFTNSIINTKRKFCCVSSPRRFGKSTNASLISAYYSNGCDSDALFRDLKIATFPEYKEHLNKYNVITLDIAALRSTYVSNRRTDTLLEEFLPFIQRKIIWELREIFSNVIHFTNNLLIIDENNNLAEAIKQIYKYSGVKFIFIIDEWDCLFRTEKDNSKLQDIYIEFLHSLFKGFISEKCIHMVYMTGILPIKKYGTQSALNNFKEYSILQPREFAPYIGFSEQEVVTLCTKYNADLNEIRRWYDGYNLPEIGSIYNPNSVTEALTSDLLTSYWCKTESYEALRQYIDLNFNGLRDAIISLLAGESVELSTGAYSNDITDLASCDDVLTLLVHLGYLTYYPSSKGSSIGAVRIPNLEIREQFRETIDSPKWSKLACILEKSRKLLEATWNLDEEEVAKGIEFAHDNFSNPFVYNNEETLRYVIQLAYFSAQNYYEIFHELSTGKGRADITFIPLSFSNKIPIIVELKYNRSASIAIKQIKSKNYMDKLIAYPEVLLVGVNYSKFTKKHTCKIEKWKF